MKTYYEEAGIKIFHGNCIEVLPQLGLFDLLLTDPPYGINLNTDSSRFSGGGSASIRKRGGGIGVSGGLPIVNDAKPFDPSFLLGFGNNQIIWGWNNFPDVLPRGACLVWLKRYDDAFGSFLSDAELAWVSKGHGIYCRRDLSNNSLQADRVHPTQKPIALMLWCLSFFPKAITVADPFMGSGTTLLAAKKSGKPCVGIEIEEKYCEIAANRLRQSVLNFETVV